MEAKEFEVEVVGGASGVRIRERCKGRIRLIWLDRSELVWLIKSFESVVCEAESRVFWDQSRRDYPRIIAQTHVNRHGGFLVVEEFVGNRRKDAIFIPEGRTGIGWSRFREELCLVSEYLRDGPRGREDGAEVPIMRRGRRSFAEVLANNDTSLEEPFGELSGPIARVPRWVNESYEGKQGALNPAKYEGMAIEHHSGEISRLPEEMSTRSRIPDTRHGVKVKTGPETREGVPGTNSDPISVTALAGGAGHDGALGRTSDTTHGAPEPKNKAARLRHNEGNVDMGALRDSLVRMREEIDYWLKGLARNEGGGKDRRARVGGLKVARHISLSKPKVKYFAAPKATWASKGKGILICPDQASVWRAKGNPETHPPRVQASLVQTNVQGRGAEPSGASSSKGVPEADFVDSIDGQPCLPVKETAVRNPVSSETDARGIGSQNCHQWPAVVCPISQPTLGGGGEQLQGQVKQSESCISPRCNSEEQGEAEEEQRDDSGEKKKGESNGGSGEVGGKADSVKEKWTCSESRVLCIEDGRELLKVPVISQMRTLELQGVHRELTGTVFGLQSGNMERVPCFGSAGGAGGEWLGGPGVDSGSPGLRVGLVGEASVCHIPGLGGLVACKEGGGAVDVGLPLNAYSPDLGGMGYSDWVMQSANEIYPIIGMTYVGHKLQLLAFLSCIEEENKEERRMGIGRSKGKREIKNLESSVNYDGKGSGLESGKRRTRGLTVVP